MRQQRGAGAAKMVTQAGTVPPSVNRVHNFSCVQRGMPRFTLDRYNRMNLHVS